MKNFFKEAFLDFIKADLVFSYRVRISILVYLALFIAFSLMQYVLGVNTPWRGMVSFTTGLILMPLLLYFGFIFKDFVSRGCKKRSKMKRPFRDKLVDYINFVILVIMYAWIVILLLLALIGLKM